MRDSMHITWGTVKPKVEAEIENLKERLIGATIEEVPALQAEAKAFLKIKDWFDRGAVLHTRIEEDPPTY